MNLNEEDNLQMERWLKVKSDIVLKKLNVKETYKIFGFTTYEGFKKAIKENRKNRYYEVVDYLEKL